MPALHEGDISERSHDVVFYRRERTKPDRAICTEFRCLDVQRDDFLSKPIPGNANLLVLFLKIRVGEWNMKGQRIGYQLYGAEFGLLDVYKRQTYDGAMPSDNSVVAMVLQTLASLTAVSYTHLDVYKRQGQRKPMMCGTGYAGGTKKRMRNAIFLRCRRMQSPPHS